MAYVSVDIRLEGIETRIVWVVSEAKLGALRMAIARGDLGTARIIAVEPYEKVLEPTLA